MNEILISIGLDWKNCAAIVARSGHKMQLSPSLAALLLDA
jgi:hypothetical protein